MKKSLLLLTIAFIFISCNEQKKNNTKIEENVGEDTLTELQEDEITETVEEYSDTDSEIISDDEPVTKKFIINDVEYTVRVKKYSEYTCVYDKNGNRIDKDGVVPVDNSYYEYDSDGKKIYKKTTDGEESRFEYDSDGNFLKEIGDSYTVYYENNKISKIEYESGRVDVYEYNEQGLLLSDGDCNWYYYDDFGNLIRQDWRDDTIYFDYDDKGNVIHYQYYRNGDFLSSENFYENVYDSNGKLIKVIEYMVID